MSRIFWFLRPPFQVANSIRPLISFFFPADKTDSFEKYFCLSYLTLFNTNHKKIRVEIESFFFSFYNYVDIKLADKRNWKDWKYGAMGCQLIELWNFLSLWIHLRNYYYVYVCFSKIYWEYYLSRHKKNPNIFLHLF